MNWQGLDIVVKCSYKRSLTTGYIGLHGELKNSECENQAMSLPSMRKISKVLKNCLNRHVGSGGPESTLGEIGGYAGRGTKKPPLL